MAAKNGYIGRAPSDSSVIVARQQYTPSGITTDFTFESGYTVGLFEVYKNGLKQLEGSEFTATDGSTFKMLSGGVGVGTALQAIAYKAFNAATATSSVGIHSAGTPISTQASVLNFIGTGNTFAVSGSTVDISIAGGGGGGSGVAATITVADESTDTTCFPVFVTDATGNVNPKSGSNLTFNSSSGALSATSFVGDVTGNVTGNINASSPTGVSTVGILTAYGTVTATTFSGNATTATTATNVTVADESSDTTCFPLFSTAATGNLAPKSGSNLTFNSGTGELSVTSASISGNLSIGGTLTYDDVTNIDSIGIVTAQTGVRVLAGGVGIADSIFHIGDDNTQIRFPAVDTVSVETDGGEKLRIDSVGRLLVDTTADRPIEQPFGNGLNSAQPGKIVVEDSGAGHLNLIVARENQSNAYGPAISLVKSRGTSDGSYTIVQSGDNLGTIQFGGADGSADRVGAAVVAQVDTTPGSDDMPARLVFATTPDGSGHPTERLRIASAGQIGLGGANYGTSGQALISNGSGSAPTWQDISAGISTAAKVISGITTTLDLSSAQDHKQTVSGIVTFTCSGGTEGDSHTIRIINSGITTVGFSTFFLFPSGAAPSLPTADGAISLISFTVNRVGGGAGVASTELLAGASVNFS